MRYLPVLLLLVCVVPAHSQDKDKAPPVVRFPVPKATPIITPPIQPQANAPARVGADELYVAESDKDCILFDSPEGVLRVTEFVGPITVRAKFAVNGNGDYETRTYSGKTVWIVEAMQTGRAELIIAELGVRDAKKAFRRTIDANKGPRPPPEPEPPGPTPVPIPDAGLRVLIVFESGPDANPLPKQAVIVNSKTLRDYLKGVCVREELSLYKAGFRMWDQDQDPKGDPYEKVWSAAMARKRASVPWICISNGVAGFEGPLPASVTDTINLIKKYER